MFHVTPCELWGFSLWLVGRGIIISYVWARGIFPSHPFNGTYPPPTVHMLTSIHSSAFGWRTEWICSRSSELPHCVQLSHSVFLCTLWVSFLIRILVSSHLEEITGHCHNSHRMPWPGNSHLAINQRNARASHLFLVLRNLVFSCLMSSFFKIIFFLYFVFSLS